MDIDARHNEIIVEIFSMVEPEICCIRYFTYTRPFFNESET